MQGQSFEKIGSNAFAELTDLWMIRLWNTSISELPANSFAQKSTGVWKDGVDISLSYNRNINSSSFNKHTFDNIESEALFSIDSPNPSSITYIQEQVFLPFFKQNSKNRLYAELGKFDCNDCSNLWLRDNKDLFARTKYLHCSNGKPIDDPDNFKYC